MRVAAPLLIAIVSLLGLPSPDFADEGGGLRLASTVWPPFTDEADHPRFALDLVHEALDRAGVAASSEMVEPADLIEDIRSGGYDGSAALWRDEDRESFLLYSDAYLENRLMLIGRKGGERPGGSFEGLTGKRVAIVQGYSYGDELEQTEGIVFVYGGDEGENLRALLQDEADYMLCDELVTRHMLENHRKEVQVYLEIGASPLVTRSLHLAVRRDHPQAEQIVGAFNGQLIRMLSDGSYNRILGVSWIRADVDGDGEMELVLGGDNAGETPPDDGYAPMGQEKRDAAADGQRYVVGGKTYESWDSIPDRYKSIDEDDPGRSSFDLFRFKF